jgi:putative DNA primase/helicase
MSSDTLKYFTDPSTLQRIGARRLSILFRPFAAELEAIKFPMPPADEPETDDYFHKLAGAIADIGALPGSVLNVLLTLEKAAAPQSSNRLGDAIKRRIPNVSLAADFVIDHALEVWFVAPEELAEFAPAFVKDEDEDEEEKQKGKEEEEEEEEEEEKEHSIGQSIELASPSVAAAILNELVLLLKRFAVLPKWVPEAVGLFVFHTFAWELRDITAYLGIESPQHRCGKSTLLAIIRRLCNRPEGAAHISGPAVFRTINKAKPTLLVDETEKVMKRNQLLAGILNASYSRELAYVIRVIPQSKKHKANGGQPQAKYIPLDVASSSSLHPDDDVARFSCWCPKAMAQIGHFPETLADRCIIITMQRKTPAEKCERLRNLKETESAELRRRCAEFVEQHRNEIAKAEPAIPEGLNDRAADIWEPLLVLADLAGGDWPERGRQAALALSGGEQTNNLISTLLLDCLLIFVQGKAERMFTRELVQKLNAFPPRPWRELSKGKPIDDIWLAKQLRPFAVRPQIFRIGEDLARGYAHQDFVEPTRRYVSKADWEAYLETVDAGGKDGTGPSNTEPQSGRGNGS